MKYIVTLFWSLVIGQVVGYIMTALASVPDNVLGTMAVSLIFALFVILFEKIAIEGPAKEN